MLAGLERLEDELVGTEPTAQLGRVEDLAKLAG